MRQHTVRSSPRRLVFFFFIATSSSTWAWISLYHGYCHSHYSTPSMSLVLYFSSPSSSSNQNEAERLKQQAEKLRKEIEALEQDKLVVERTERQRLEQERAAEIALRDRYSATVPILKPDGNVQFESCNFPPRYMDGTSFITVCEADLPLGLILGEGENELTGFIVVDEVASGSNGDRCGIVVGDIIRACTACKMGMDMPTWQVLAGGIGVPKTRRFMYAVDRRPFEEVMDAIASNRMDPEQRPVLIVVERRETQ